MTTNLVTDARTPEHIASTGFGDDIGGEECSNTSLSPSEDNLREREDQGICEHPDMTDMEFPHQHWFTFNFFPRFCWIHH